MLDFDPLLRKLTRPQEQAIRQVFKRKRRADTEAHSLIVGWYRLSEVAHQYALGVDAKAWSAAMLVSPPVRRLRDRQLRQAAKAARSAIQSIIELVDLYGKHFRRDNWDHMLEVERWVESVVGWLRSMEKATEDHRVVAQTWPAVAKRRGTPRWLPESCLLQVLAAYFRNQDWPVTQTQTGLFAEVAFVVLGSRSTMNHARLKALAKSRLDYEALEAVAPRDVEFAKPPITRKNPHGAT